MKTRKSPPRPARLDNEVDAFMAGLMHPQKVGIEFVRRIILGVSPEISEAVKWKAPSFRTTEFFATFNLRVTDRVQLIFHLGAKVRPDQLAMTIMDPAGLMKWLAKDRCLVTVGTGKEIRANQGALEEIVRQWVPYI